MSENTAEVTETEVTKPEPVKGTWQDTLAKSAVLFERSGKARKQASTYLWTGAVSGIEEWLPTADTDVSGENFYSEVLDLLGAARKGDASKIRTVAVAVRSHGLDLAQWGNLSKAYGEAIRLTKTVKAEREQDDAAEEAVEAIKASAPKSTSTPEGAAAIVLSGGVDEAARLLLDALGETNASAHRSFLRAVSQEIAGRVPKPEPKPVAKKAAPKKGATPAVKTAATKAKPVPVSRSKGDPNAKALPAKKAAPVAKKAAPVKGRPVAVKR